MDCRKEKFKKRKPSKQMKFLVCALFLSFGIASSINIAFANENIQLMLQNWFNQQKANSIGIIESAIMSEKERQVMLLKEEVQKKINDAEQQLAEFTETEKEARIRTIQTHANQLIQNMTINTIEEQTAITTQLDYVLTEAINRMNEISTSISPTEPIIVESATESNPPEKMEPPVNEPSEGTESAGASH
ncbi:hypothetical protein [Bacillus sp. 1P02SD]|uniref:hypothetical protein n=1 Tax=Bacillus sp. 1P02SD TaxID=3132264 RepID=UPI00399F6325